MDTPPLLKHNIHLQNLDAVIVGQVLRMQIIVQIVIGEFRILNVFDVEDYNLLDLLLFFFESNNTTNIPAIMNTISKPGRN